MAEVCVKDLSHQNFVVNHNAIQEGDIVVIYCDPENMVFVAVKRGITVNMKHGALRHEFLIGKRYGSKISATAGSVYALRPFPALWTKVLKRHTQILYSPEVSMILNLLDIAPGSTVCESGTGSGSLTHALAVAVGAEGRVFTHDIEEPQVQKMTREARQHGLEGRVFPSLRDVVSDGFSVQGEASAVFLDLPCPWAAVGHALAALDRTKACRLVSFSPCIEQTQELSAALVEHGFVGVKTVELINTQFKADSVMSHSVADLEQSTAARKAIRRNARSEVLQSADVPTQPEGKRLRCLVASPDKQPTHAGYLTSATLLAQPASS